MKKIKVGPIQNASAQAVCLRNGMDNLLYDNIADLKKPNAVEENSNLAMDVEPASGTEQAAPTQPVGPVQDARKAKQAKQRNVATWPTDVGKPKPEFIVSSQMALRRHLVDIAAGTFKYKA